MHLLSINIIITSPKGTIHPIVYPLDYFLNIALKIWMKITYLAI